jgi:hypothetical protein
MSSTGFGRLLPDAVQLPESTLCGLCDRRLCGIRTAIADGATNDPSQLRN